MEGVITVYGRRPVLEALADDRVLVEQVLIDRTARGEGVDGLVEAAARRGVPVHLVSPEKVTRISGNGRHDQGVVADVVAPALRPLDDWLTGRDGALSVMVLDGVTNPANVGMILRTATAAGLDGVVLPKAGVPEVGPLVVKASAGVAFHATILGVATASGAVEVLAAAGVASFGLRGGGEPIFTAGLPERAAYVLGNETDGISTTVARRIDRWLAIPMSGGVESLNVASAAAVLAYEINRRRTLSA